MSDRRIIGRFGLVPSLVVLALCVLVALGMWLALSSRSAEAKQTISPRPAVLGNGKGFALAGSVLSMPTAGPGSPWAYRLQQERWSPALLAKTKQAGFGFIRLIGDIRPITAQDPAARARGLAWIDNQVDQANAAGLGVLVNIDYWPNSSDPSRNPDKVIANPVARQAVIRAYATMAANLASDPARKVGFELISEPTCTPSSGPNAWPAVQLEMWKAVRRVAPTLPLVLTGCRARVDTVVEIDPTPYAGDPNIIWSFHYYDFFGGQESWKFQGVPFPPKPDLANSTTAIRAMVPAQVSNTRLVNELRDYLQNDKGPATMQQKIAMIAAWAKRYGIPPSHISMNEWAPVLSNRPENQAIRPDSLLWINTLREAAEREGFNWAYWTLPSTDLNYDPSTQFFRQDTLTAFGLKPAR